MESRREIAVMMTVYDEQNTIGELIDKVPKVYDIYIVDDGSTDRTADIARQHGAKVISLPINLGQGAAAVTCYKVVAMNNYRFIVKMDGDGQHRPEEIENFVKELKETDYDMIVGSRVSGSNYKEAPLFRRFFLYPLTWFLNSLTGYKLNDSMCGFRAFRGESFKKMISIFERIIESEYMASEMLIRFSQEGFKVKNIPISLLNRSYGFSYKGTIKYGWGIILAIIRAKLDTYKSRKEI